GAPATALVAHKEEGAVLAVIELGQKDWPAEGAAELVLLERALGVEARVAGLQSIVAQEVPQSAMHSIGSGPHGDVHLRRAHAEFRGIERVLNFELLDGVNGRNGGGRLEQTLVAGDAVDQEADGCGPRAVHADHAEAVVQTV